MVNEQSVKMERKGQDSKVSLRKKVSYQMSQRGEEGVKGFELEAFTNNSCCNSSCSKCLINEKDVPDYQRRKFIQDGYRPILPIWRAVKTTFRWHNETGNIWTHAPGIFYVGYKAIYWYTGEGLESDWWSFMFMSMMFGSLFSVYASSTVYHIMVCGSRCTAGCCLLADMGSIAIHITFAFFSAIYVAYWCRPGLRAFYMLWSCGVFLLMIVPQILDGGQGSFASRICAVAAVASGLVPTVHAVLSSTEDEARLFMFPIFGMFAFYGIGGAFYFTHFPEVKWPGRFDYIAHSHQFWHLCVLAAGTSFMHCVVELYSHQTSISCDDRGHLSGYFLEKPTSDISILGLSF